MADSDSHGSITRRLEQLQADDPATREAAACEIFSRYFARLVSLAASKLSAPIRAREEGEEIALDAMKSFFVRYQNGKYSVENRDELLNLLTAITINKVREAARRHSCAKRTVQREQAGDLVGAGARSDGAQFFHYLASTEPGPEEAAIVRDLIDQLPDENLKRIVWLRLEGNTDQQIAETFDCSGETIRLRRQRIIRRWRQMAEDLDEV